MNQSKRQLLDQTNTIGIEMDKINELSLTYKEMVDRPFVWVSMDQAVGMIAAKMLIPYPPGIPLLMPGEKVTSEQVLIIQNYHLTECSLPRRGRAVESRQNCCFQIIA